MNLNLDHKSDLSPLFSELDVLSKHDRNEHLRELPSRRDDYGRCQGTYSRVNSTCSPHRA